MSLSESLSGDAPEYVASAVQTPPAISGKDRLIDALDGLFEVQDIQEITNRRSQGVLLKGVLLGDAEALYPLIAERFKAIGYTPTLQRQGKTDVIIAVEGLMVARRFSSSGWVHAALLVATLITTLFGGAALQGHTFDNIVLEVFGRHNLGYLWTALASGAPFAFTLLLILGTHEMGHYIAARRHGIDVTLPYFIPMPISILGTMGAVIFIKSALTNRKALFDVGISGPLAGFVVALGAFMIGLRLPHADFPSVALTQMFGAFGVFKGLGVPLLLRWIGSVIAPHSNLQLLITEQPVLLAAWFGMLLTVLNLMPIGQLDGGHVTYALFGRAAWVVATVAFAAMS